MLAVLIHQSNHEKNWPQDGNLLEGEEMLAIHPSIKPEINHSSRKKGIMATRWKPPSRRGDLAIHQSIKPENQSLVEEKRNNVRRMETA